MIFDALFKLYCLSLCWLCKTPLPGDHKYRTRGAQISSAKMYSPAEQKGGAGSYCGQQSITLNVLQLSHGSITVAASTGNISEVERLLFSSHIHNKVQSCSGHTFSVLQAGKQICNSFRCGNGWFLVVLLLFTCYSCSLTWLTCVFVYFHCCDHTIMILSANHLVMTTAPRSIYEPQLNFTLCSDVWQQKICKWEQLYCELGCIKKQYRWSQRAGGNSEGDRPSLLSSLSH